MKKFALLMFMLSPLLVNKGVVAPIVKGYYSCYGLVSNKVLSFAHVVANDDDEDEQNDKKPFKRMPKRPA